MKRTGKRVRVEGTVRYKKSLIHFVADCKVCGERWEDYLTGQKQASEHARKTGHKVIADLGYVVEYGT